MAALPSDARILLVGLDPAAAECVRRLLLAGARHFTVLDGRAELGGELAPSNPWIGEASGGPVAEGIAGWVGSTAKELGVDAVVEARVEDPAAIVSKEPEWILSFDLTITFSVDREVELALGEVIFKAPPKALIISRSDEFHAKFRSLYGDFIDKSSPDAPALQGIMLDQRPSPPLPEKCERVRKAFTSAVDVTPPEVVSFLLVVYATGAVFQRTQGYPPAHRPAAVSLAGHEADVEAVIREQIAERGLAGATVDSGAVRAACAEGWSALPLTAKVFGAAVAQEGITLVTSRGRPCDSVPLNLAAQVALGIPVVF